MCAFAVKIHWEESERGWGTRPDGTSVHISQEEADAFIKAHWDRYTEMFGDAVPDEYSRPVEVMPFVPTPEIEAQLAEKPSFWLEMVRWV